ncbi:MAG: hypothetical protein KGI71_05615 [Patescibacteria group bacterium]|nr:hypothetical protein [Patescibacteria group bacterium]
MAYTPGINETVQVTFTSNATGAVTDPTTLSFSYTNNAISYGAYTYAGSSTPGVGYVYKISTGVYAFQIVTTGFVGPIDVTWTPTGIGLASASKSITQNTAGVNFTYSLGQLIDDTLRHLRGTTRDAVNVLAVAMDAPAAGTVETITLTGDLAGVAVGSLLVIETETLYVLNSYPATVTAQVIRGYEDTTPATHAANVLVYVNPPWTRNVVMGAIRDEIRSWGPQLYQVASVDIPLVNFQRGYDLGAIPGQIIRVLYVTAPQPPYIGAPGYWDVAGTVDYDQSNPSLPFMYNPNANPSEFPSGRSLVLTGTHTPNFAGNIHVVYAAPFDVDNSWAETTDMIAEVGLDPRDLDIPPLGVAARLLEYIAPRRAMANVQGQSRDDQMIPMASILQASQQFQLRAQSRKTDAQQRLLSDFPYRMSNY